MFCRLKKKGLAPKIRTFYTVVLNSVPFNILSFVNSTALKRRKRRKKECLCACVGGGGGGGVTPNICKQTNKGIHYEPSGLIGR